MSSQNMVRESSYDPSPLLITLSGAGSNFLIPVHCHLLDLICYAPYNDIIFRQPAQPIGYRRW